MFYPPLSCGFSWSEGAMFYLPPSCVFTGLCGFPAFRRAVVILNALAVVVGTFPTFSVSASFETDNSPKRAPIWS